jgi:hypothetical protein
MKYKIYWEGSADLSQNTSAAPDLEFESGSNTAAVLQAQGLSEGKGLALQSLWRESRGTFGGEMHQCILSNRTHYGGQVIGNSVVGSKTIKDPGGWQAAMEYHRDLDAYCARVARNSRPLGPVRDLATNPLQDGENADDWVPVIQQPK